MFEQTENDFFVRDNNYANPGQNRCTRTPVHESLTKSRDTCMNARTHTHTVIHTISW